MTQPDASEDAETLAQNSTREEQLDMGAAMEESRRQARAAPVGEKARAFADRQRQGGAGRLGSVAKAVHRAADEIGRESPSTASYVHSGAERLERASSVLQDNSFEDLVRMAESFAREQPLAFIGGSLAAGFVLSRILRHAGEPPGEATR